MENDPLKMFPPSRGTKFVCGPSPIASAVMLPVSCTATSSMVAGFTAELKFAPPIGVPTNMPSRSCVLRPLSCMRNHCVSSPLVPPTSCCVGLSGAAPGISAA